MEVSKKEKYAPLRKKLYVDRHKEIKKESKDANEKKSKKRGEMKYGG